MLHKNRMSLTPPPSPQKKKHQSKIFKKHAYAADNSFMVTTCLAELQPKRVRQQP